MGQQQLLLVILVTIIVGIATVVALNVFGTQAEQANRDAVRQDIMAAATSAQGYFIRPVMMGGGGGSFDEIEIGALNIPGSINDAGTEVTNENGTYSLSLSGDDLVVTGEPSGGSEDMIGTITRDEDGQWTIAWSDIDAQQ